MAKRIGLLTAGGDAPGLNFCLKTIVYNAIDHGYEVVGIRKGWQGLLYYDPDDSVTHSDQAMIMTKARVRDIDRAAGSFLHSSRIDPGSVHSSQVPVYLRVNADQNQRLDLTNHVKRSIEHLQLDTLIVLGNHLALQYAHRLSEAGIPIVGIPKSVHNDIPGTAYSLGFSTAMRRGVTFMREVRELAASREEIAVVSVLGHNSGQATMTIAVFANADRTLIPEVPFDPHRLGELLLADRQANPSNYAVLAMSEGAHIDPTTAPEEVAELSADVVVAERRGSGPMITRVLERVIQQHLLYQPLSYLTRTGDTDGWDLMAATNFGITATTLATQNKAGRFVAYRLRDGYVDVPLVEVTHPPKVDITELYDADNYKPKPKIFELATRRAASL